MMRTISTRTTRSRHQRQEQGASVHIAVPAALAFSEAALGHADTMHPVSSDTCAQLMKPSLIITVQILGHSWLAFADAHRSPSH